jgi:hypothetical protein
MELTDVSLVENEDNTTPGAESTSRSQWFPARFPPRATLVTRRMRRNAPLHLNGSHRGFSG